MSRENTGVLKNKNFRLSLGILIIVLTAVVALNIALISRTDSAKIEAEGQMRLANIAGRVENSLYQSECLLDSVSTHIQHIIDNGDDVDAYLTNYFVKDTIEDISERSDGSCFSVYAAYNSKLYINGFVPGDDFVLEERTWYVEAKKRMGAVNITEPYVDASTGEMCYTVSKLLEDGSTVVGLDFKLSGVQKYIEEMDLADTTDSKSTTSMIVNDAGMIIGHSDISYVGKFCKEDIDQTELLNKVFMLYGDSFSYSADDGNYTVFSEKTKYDWYLIVTIEHGIGFGGISGISIYIILFMIVFAFALVIFYIHSFRNKQRAEKKLSERVEYTRELEGELRKHLFQIINRSDVISNNSENGYLGTEIKFTAEEMDCILKSLCEEPNIKKTQKTVIKNRKNNNHRKQSILITIILLLSSIFSVLTNTMNQVSWGNTKMQKETETYYYQVEEWVISNRAVLDVISDSIAAQKDFAADYDSAITYLDKVVSKYDDISVAYICNPAWEHTVLMNNGWEPDSSWHVEERQWYIDTMLSHENFNISAPYWDEQTGLYCTTLSKIVYDEKGNFIGVLGIDYYLDKLIGILGESYTDNGYAFLTDIDGNILNHPNSEYQMKADSTSNAAELCYRPALSDSEVSAVRDYDGKWKACLAMKEKTSGFTVIVIKNIEEIFGNAVISDVILALVFLICIVIITVILRRVSKWQEQINIELKEAAEDAIKAGKAKNTFLANMSHEIRTPINAVLGMNEMIQRESTNEQILEYSDNIQSAGKTLLSLINDILDFSKIESGKMEIIPVEYRPKQVISDVIIMIQSRAEKKGLEFITEIDTDLPSVLYGDDVRIRQIVTNILTNAVKYTQKGNIRFKIHIAEINTENVKLEISVSDTGMGIKEEDIDKLYTSFQRLDQEKNRNVEGTGLGISIVAQLLKMMGSELKVTSVYGVGSTFSFVIEQRVINAAPMGNLENKDRKNRAQKESSLTAPEAKVLIVDDNETNLLVARSLLKRTLCRVETAVSGAECLRLLKKKNYNIVFLDHMMPEMDGIETLQKIKEEGIAEETKFIVLTANAIQGAKQEYMDAGFDGYLSKPIDVNELENCLFGNIPAEMVIESETADKKQEKKTEPEINNSTLIDFSVGRTYTGGEENTYRAILENYYRQGTGKKEKILSLYADKDWKNYIIEVHALKSSSLTIGAISLSELAKKLELAGKAGDIGTIDLENTHLAELYNNVLIEAAEYLGINTQVSEKIEIQAELKEIDTACFEKLKTSLRKACENYDGDSIIQICEEYMYCRFEEKILSESLGKIKAYAEDFEYDSALGEVDLM